LEGKARGRWSTGGGGAASSLSPWVCGWRGGIRSFLLLGEDDVDGQPAGAEWPDHRRHRSASGRLAPDAAAAGDGGAQEREGYAAGKAAGGGARLGSQRRRRTASLGRSVDRWDWDETMRLLFPFYSVLVFVQALSSTVANRCK
jgi:hypothetical protein